MIDISSETEVRIHQEAQRQGVSVDALLERLLSEHATAAHVAGLVEAPKLPRLHLGVMGALHRRDIYDDVPRRVRPQALCCRQPATFNNAEQVTS